MSDLVVFEKIQYLAENDVELFDFAQGNSFPYFFQGATKNYAQFAHVLMLRDERNLPVSGRINSEFYKIFESFFLRMCEQNNIEVHTILRAAINCTSHADEQYGDIHVDHTTFNHYNFLFYMNEIDGGNTYIFNDKKEIIKEIQHAKHKLAVFSGHPHAQGFCKPNQHRFILIFTFLGFFKGEETNERESKENN